MNMKSITKKLLDEISYKVIGAAIEVHKHLGPGLLESVYHNCMFHELRLQGLYFKSQIVVPVNYKGLEINADLRCDFLVDECLCVELKAVEGIAPIHEAQLLTYMKLLNVPKGLLINFNCTNIFKEGQRTMVNELYRSLSET